MTSHHQLLLAVCRFDLRAELAPDAIEACRGAELEPTLELAAGHRLSGRTLRFLLAHPGLESEMTGERRHALETALAQLRRRAGWVDLARDDLLGRLADADVTTVALKGAGLAGTVYTERVDRELADIDLLVPANRLKPAVRALMAAGYRCDLDRRGIRGYRRHHFHFQFERKGMVAELHWDLTRPGMHFHLDPARVLERAVETTGRDGVRLITPCPEHALLTIVLQNLQEGFSRLSRTVDLDSIVRAHPQIDWERLADDAWNARLRKPLALSLQLCRQVSATPLPAGYIASLGTHPVSRLHLELFRPVHFLLEQRARRRASAVNLLWIWLLPTLGLKARTLGSLLLRRAVDPLDWLWKRDRPEETLPRSLPTRCKTFVKVLVYQAYLYARGAWQAPTAAGAASRRFWRDDVQGDS